MEPVTVVKFIKPFPLLITSDTGGYLYIWLTKPHKQAGECMLSWRNTFTLQQNCPITVIDTYYRPATGEGETENEVFLLLIGDEMGNVRVQDIRALLQTAIEIRPVDTKEMKRNPHREIPMKQQSRERGVTKQPQQHQQNDADIKD